MFRYRALALESDWDEFGYTDASDIEIESEILEIGDEYEDEEPAFQRAMQQVFREVPPPSVPLTHPAVLPGDAPPPQPAATEGLLGLPKKESRPDSAAPRRIAGEPPNPAVAPLKGPAEKMPAATGKTRARSDTVSGQRTAPSTLPVAAPPSGMASASSGGVLPRKTPGKEQAPAPLASQQKAAPAPGAAAESLRKKGGVAGQVRGKAPAGVAISPAASSRRSETNGKGKVSVAPRAVAPEAAAHMTPKPAPKPVPPTRRRPSAATASAAAGGKKPVAAVSPATKQKSRSKAPVGKVVAAKGPAKKVPSATKGDHASVAPPVGKPKASLKSAAKNAAPVGGKKSAPAQAKSAAGTAKPAASATKPSPHGKAVAKTPLKKPARKR